MANKEIKDTEDKTNTNGQGVINGVSTGASPGSIDFAQHVFSDGVGNVARGIKKLAESEQVESFAADAQSLANVLQLTDLDNRMREQRGNYYEVETNATYGDGMSSTLLTESGFAATGAAMMGEFGDTSQKVGLNIGQTMSQNLNEGVDKQVNSFLYNTYMNDPEKAAKTFFGAVSNNKIDVDAKSGVGTISFSSQKMASVAAAFSDLFTRFASSYQWVDQIINQILQNGNDSAIDSHTYGAELKKYWDDNAEQYAEFPTLAGNWVDLINMTVNKNEEAIYEVVEEYKRLSN